MTDSVRIGVVGAGVFGSYHAAKFAALDDAIVTGVFDIDHTRAEALADQCGATAYQDFSGLLMNADGVVIAAPATRHHSLALEALNGRRHLLVEKPLAVSIRQANALIETAAARGVVLQVGHQERYVCRAAGLFHIARTPIRIECVRRVPHTGRCEDVSVAFDLMVHDIDIVQQLANSKIRNIRASGGHDEIDAEIVLENGVVVSIIACRRAMASERRMTIVYSDGVIEFDFIKRVLTDRGTQKKLGGLNGGTSPLALRDPLAHGAALFVAAMRGEADAIVTGEDGRACIDWAARIEAAAGLADADDVARPERLRA